MLHFCLFVLTRVWSTPKVIKSDQNIYVNLLLVKIQNIAGLFSGHGWEMARRVKETNASAAAAAAVKSKSSSHSWHGTTLIYHLKVFYKHHGMGSLRCRSLRRRFPICRIMPYRWQYRNTLQVRHWLAFRSVGVDNNSDGWAARRLNGIKLFCIWLQNFLGATTLPYAR